MTGSNSSPTRSNDSPEQDNPSVKTYDQPESGASADAEADREIRQSSPASDRMEQKQDIAPEAG